MNLQTLDWVGYHAHRELIDFWLLTLADGSPQATPARLMAKLREVGIGDAQSDDRVALSYSSTGAIYRSAMNRLQRNGWIEDPWSHGRKLSAPMQITSSGRRHLASLPTQEERGLFV